MTPSHVRLLFLLALTLVSSTSANLNPFTKFSVKIVNNLPANKSPLVVHCKSGDIDKGEQHLKPNEVFEFGFHVNFQGSTLFFCHLSYLNQGWHSAVFDVFRAKEDFVHDLCSDDTCTWIAKEDGICSYNSRTLASMLMYSWRNGPMISRKMIIV